MSLEGRLYVVLRESVGGQYSSYGALATKIFESGPAEFSYNRLEERHVMQPSSIVAYVSLVHFIGLLKVNEAEEYVGILDEEPTQEGAEELINRKAIAKLEESGFGAKQFGKAVGELIRGEVMVLPSVREIYQAIGLKMSEQQFVSLCALGGVRRHFGFSMVTRRIMIPAQVA